MEKTNGNGTTIVEGKASEKRSTSTNESVPPSKKVEYFELHNSERVSYALVGSTLSVHIDLKDLLKGTLYRSSTGNTVVLVTGSALLDEIDLGIDDLRLGINLLSKDARLMKRAIARPEKQKTAKPVSNKKRSTASFLGDSD